MINFRKKLHIAIEEQTFDEDEILTGQIKKESFNINLGSSFLNYLLKSEEEKNKILELNNNTMNQVVAYMESENHGQDFSYQW
jgi:hypothetical protein